MSNSGELIHFLRQVVLQVCDASKLPYLLHSLSLFKFCQSSFSELLVSDFSFPLLCIPCSLKVFWWKMLKNHHIIFLLKQYSYAYLSFDCIHLHIQIQYKTFQQYSERTFERYFHHNWVSQSITFSAGIKLKILKCCSNIVKHVRNVTSDSARSAKSPILFAERCRIARRKSSFDTLDRFQRLVGTPIQKLSFPIVTASLLLIFCMFTRDGCQNKMECRKLVCDKYFDCSEA